MTEVESLRRQLEVSETARVAAEEERDRAVQQAAEHRQAHVEALRERDEWKAKAEMMRDAVQIQQRTESAASRLADAHRGEEKPVAYRYDPVGLQSVFSNNGTLAMLNTTVVTPLYEHPAPSPSERCAACFKPHKWREGETRNTASICSSCGEAGAHVELSLAAPDVRCEESMGDTWCQCCGAKVAVELTRPPQYAALYGCGPLCPACMPWWLSTGKEYFGEGCRHDGSRVDPRRPAPSPSARAELERTKVKMVTNCCFCLGSKRKLFDGGEGSDARICEDCVRWFSSEMKPSARAEEPVWTTDTDAGSGYVHILRDGVSVAKSKSRKAASEIVALLNAPPDLTAEIKTLREEPSETGGKTT